MMLMMSTTMRAIAGDDIEGLFRSVGLQVRTFGFQAQGFVESSAPDSPRSACVLDVRLQGMARLDFQAELA